MPADAQRRSACRCARPAAPNEQQARAEHQTQKGTHLTPRARNAAGPGGGRARKSGRRRPARIGRRGAKAAGSLELITASREDICGSITSLSTRPGHQRFLGRVDALQRQYRDERPDPRRSRQSHDNAAETFSPANKGRVHIFTKASRAEFACRVHSWYSTVGRSEIEAFGLSDLTDDEAVRSHS